MQQKQRDKGHKKHDIEQGTSHQESLSEHLEGGVEEAQLAIDETYLPEQVDASAVDEAIATAIRDSGAQNARDQGKVMQLLSARLRGRADMKAVSARVQALLAQSTRS